MAPHSLLYALANCLAVVFATSASPSSSASFYSYIDIVPGYDALPSCASTKVSQVVRAMSSGCADNPSSSRDCFCDTTSSWTQMNSVLGSAVWWNCNSLVEDVDSALAVYATYCAHSAMTAVATTTTVDGTVSAGLAIAAAVVTSTSTPQTSSQSTTSVITTITTINTIESASSSSSTSSATSTSASNSSSSSSNVGSIVGGVVGGVAGLALVLGCAWFIWSRRKRARKNESQLPTNNPAGPYAKHPDHNARELHEVSAEKEDRFEVPADKPAYEMSAGNDTKQIYEVPG